jgi:diphosphomevalonate decarboxylase
MKSYLAEAHPNIALIKYWGKKPSQNDEDRNLGLNPSVSMTLSPATTDVKVSAGQGSQHEIWIEGTPANPADYKKLVDHILRIEKLFKFKPQVLKIESKNNFPKGTGIASSASAFAALTYGITAFHRQSTNFTSEDLPLLSSLARRGSGSAARSTEGGFMKWEREYAENLNLDWKLRDTIVIFSSEPKKVSSTDGHKAVLSSPQWPKRQENLKKRYARCLEALRQRDLKTLGPLIEEEALEMHAIAETSVPPIQYRSESTLRFLKALEGLSSRNFFFTIDAGPNLHLISEAPVRKEVE